MLTVKASARASTVEGIGLFADQKIPKGTVLWRFNPRYVYSIDDSRFINHSSINNNIDVVDIPGELETCDVANRDIEVGEELLINYREIDAHNKESDESYLET